MRKLKDYALVFMVAVFIVLAVLASHFSDMANTPFWWKFWSAAGIVSIILLAAGFAYLFSKNNSGEE